MTFTCLLLNFHFLIPVHVHILECTRLIELILQFKSLSKTEDTKATLIFEFQKVKKCETLGWTPSWRIHGRCFLSVGACGYSNVRAF